MLGQQYSLAENRVNNFRRGVVNVNVANAKTASFTAKNVVFPQRNNSLHQRSYEILWSPGCAERLLYDFYTSIWQRQSDDTRDAQW